jgi:hypothetical protein
MHPDPFEIKDTGAYKFFIYPGAVICIRIDYFCQGQFFKKTAILVIAGKFQSQLALARAASLSICTVSIPIFRREHPQLVYLCMALRWHSRQFK